MYSLHDPDLFGQVVSQFGNLRVKAYVRLTAAYRRLSRPSSAPDAKAFALCSFQLELYSRKLLLPLWFSWFLYP